MTEIWNRRNSYYQGQRCRHGGKLYEAGFDICRGIQPDSLGSEKLWRRLPTVSVPVKANDPGRKAPSGYLTRAMGHR